MGYYTSYYLDVINIDTEETLNKIVAEIEKRGLTGYVFDANYDKRFENNDGKSYYTLNYYCRESQKWYKYQDDMEEISALFPNAIFRVHGEGEDWDDIWDHYFFHGESEYCPYKIEPTKPRSIEWPRRW